MSNNELLTDDYVAELLAQDAKDCSLKYSAMGMEAFRENKKPSSGLKPNTRFLRHIIRDTDAHNKALLAKEAAESRARLSDLERVEEMRRIKSNPDARDIRKRQMGDIRAILGHKSRARDDDDHERPKKRRRSSERNKDKDGRERRATQRRDDLFERGGDSRRHHGRLSERDSDHNKHMSDRHKHKRSRERGYDDTSEEDDRKERRRISKRDRSRSPRKERKGRDERDERDERRHRQKHRSHHRSPIRRISPKRDVKHIPPRHDEDSDPLEDFIGPPPPPNRRGRGTIGGAAELDRRFSDSYDPKLDVQMDVDNDEDPWDEAVESFRDRQKMRLNQDQRMRDAGFTDEQINRAKGIEAMAEPHVVWSKAGEKREWDKGKGVGVGVGEDASNDDEEVFSGRRPTLFSEEY
ncbi:hypothetical protein E4U47_006731 [Claviceps purpurea]|nr:hypothetical protein E4U51_008042 [Claviceps purpurea]KAG6197540.1 hypothetical protein E4U10_008244 [Claviceps purpurea]KAG6223453.1 hypothetical protein E4U26_004541 [Claviceps purpurea]KAG6264806.1 hypothetical protein E4U47_006731 [Claviceps purpurea]